LVGDIVELIGTNGFDGQYTVYSIGLENGDLKNYYFVIDVPNLGSITSTSRMRKIVDEIPVQYYFRIFKKINQKKIIFYQIK